MYGLLVLQQSISGEDLWYAAFGLLGLVLGIRYAARRKREIWPNRKTFRGKLLASFEIGMIAVVWYVGVSFLGAVIYVDLLR